VHFHVPVNADRLSDELSTTNDHLRAALDVIAKAPGASAKFEIETYTWRSCRRGPRGRRRRHDRRGVSLDARRGSRSAA
jgi:hypothetical protein